MIGDHIEVRVSRIENEVVRLGIVAPRDLPVFREEIYRKIREANREAARRGAAALPQISLPKRPE